MLKEIEEKKMHVDWRIEEV